MAKKQPFPALGGAIHTRICRCPCPFTPCNASGIIACAMPLPPLRNLDITPVEHESQTLICLRDPEGYVQDQMLLSLKAFFIASCLDGSNEVVDIQAAFARQFNGALLMSDDVAKVVDNLDENGFLQTERFGAILREAKAAFGALDTRPGSLAGKTYPDDAGELRAFIDAVFLEKGGPGATPGPDPGESPPLPCLIVPHIDFDRGGRVYAHGYLEMSKHGKPDTVFVFGVSHAGGAAPFILTRKHFETPFGVLETDRDTVGRLAEACAWEPYDDEILHRAEHSIEFQAVMLSYLYGTSVRIVPILCAQLVDGSDAHPKDAKDVCAFLAACRKATEALNGKAAVVAGADLAHVGRRFGDPFDIDDSVLRSVEQRDREDLAFVTAGDADGFYASVMKDGNRRKVCGLGCIYSALKAVPGPLRKGALRHYDQAEDPAGGIVSFADIAFQP